MYPANVPHPLPAQQSLPRPKLQHLSDLRMLLLGGGIGCAVIMIAVTIVTLGVAALLASTAVLPGVVVHGPGIDDVSAGGLSSDQVAARLQNTSVTTPITLQDGNKIWSIAASDLGISIDTQATANKVSQAGHENFLAGLSTVFGGNRVTPVYTLDLARAETALTTASKIINPPASDDVSAPTRTLNVDATLDKLPPNLETLLNNPVVPLVMDESQGPRTTYTVQRGEELGLISKKFNVPISDIMTLNGIKDANQIYPGQTLIIPAAGVWVPTEADAPPAPLTQGKSIVVALTNQRIYAYQDGHLIHSSLMSSGLPGHETVIGDYHIYVKYVTTRMTGPGYDIPDVPWTMYFYQGYGIHGAYWHNDFGREMSHGCVNLDTTEAKWFYDFAPVGTLVRVLA